MIPRPVGSRLHKSSDNIVETLGRVGPMSAAAIARAQRHTHGDVVSVLLAAERRGEVRRRTLIDGGVALTVWEVVGWGEDEAPDAA